MPLERDPADLAIDIINGRGNWTPERPVGYPWRFEHGGLRWRWYRDSECLVCDRKGYRMVADDDGWDQVPCDACDGTGNEAPLFLCTLDCGNHVNPLVDNWYWGHTTDSAICAECWEAGR